MTRMTPSTPVLVCIATDTRVGHAVSEILAVAGDYRVRLEQDWDWENPREHFACVAHVITTQPGRNGYEEVDSRGGGPLEDAWNEVLSRRYLPSSAEEIFMRWARAYRNAVVVVYAPVNGPRTLWYVLRSDTKHPLHVLAQEMGEYADWLHGEVYRYIFDLFVPPTWKPFAIGNGLVGYDHAKDVALAQFRHLSHDSHDETCSHDSHDGNTQP